VRLRRIKAFPGPRRRDTAHLLASVQVRAEEAAARGEDVSPAHWLLALLRDAEDPVDVALNRYPVERQKRSMFGLPDHGPNPIRLLVEAHD
jgi:hypothetical protein